MLVTEIGISASKNYCRCKGKEDKRDDTWHSKELQNKAQRREFITAW